MNIREKLIEYGYQDSILYENPSFDGSIIGIDACSGSVIYNYDLMIEELSQKENMTIEEAMEFIDYNTIRATPYMPTPRPIVLNKFEDE